MTGAAKQEGIAAAKRIRETWLKELSHGAARFEHVVELSQHHETRALGKLGLKEILSGRPGWTEMDAIEAIRHIGLSEKDTVLSIRRYDRKVSRFSALLNATPNQWRARPQMPAGWPWRGKLQLLLQSQDHPVPPELTGTSPPAENEQEDDILTDDDVLDQLLDDSVDDDELGRLLGDDDER